MTLLALKAYLDEQVTAQNNEIEIVLTLAEAAALAADIASAAGGGSNNP